MSAASTKPPPELEALDYFVGIWACTGRLEATATTPARKTHGRLICRWELGKYFLGVAEDDERRWSSRGGGSRAPTGATTRARSCTRARSFSSAAAASSERRRAGAATS